MATSITMKIDTKKLQRSLYLAGQSFSKSEILSVIGDRILKFVDDNFRKNGALVGGWAPLSPNTVAARRKRSSRPLQDTGRLKQSFVKKVRGSSVSVGSQIEYAEYHQFGTKPYRIFPSGAYLRFMTTQGWIYAKKVNHPGLPARPMLPNRTDAGILATGVVDAIAKKAVKLANQR